jgi:hypothetical protein
VWIRRLGIFVVIGTFLGLQLGQTAEVDISRDGERFDTNGLRQSSPRCSNPPSIRLDSGSSEVFAFAPAIEYSWKPNLGVLLGARVIPAAHTTHATITPAVAINFVR